MEQLIAHLFGDYILQNHWMANKKLTSFPVALIHALFYGLPFLFLTHSPVAIGIIVLSHAIIDRLRLAKYWCQFWGVGQSSVFAKKVGTAAPPFLSVWLLIIVDNTIHLLINYLSLLHFSS